MFLISVSPVVDVMAAAVLAAVLAIVYVDDVADRLLVTVNVPLPVIVAFGIDPFKTRLDVAIPAPINVLTVMF